MKKLFSHPIFGRKIFETQNESLLRKNAKEGFNVVRRRFLSSADEVFAPRLSAFYDHISITGAPMSFGQPLLGVESGPHIIRKAGLVSRLAKTGWRVQDNGDIDFPVPERGSPTRFRDAVGKCNEILCQRILKNDKKDTFSLILGGDHSIALGSISAQLMRNPDLQVIWVDAHADINTAQTTPTGNYHGMVAAILLKLFEPPGHTFEWLKKVPPLHPENLVYIGLRDVDIGEKYILKKHKICAFSMFDIDRYGIGDVMKRAEEHLNLSRKNDAPVHLTYDIDALDPFFAPATGTTVRGGLTYREAHFVSEYLSQWGRLVAMDMVEVNPHVCVDADQETAKCATSLISSALGESILLN